ncbi:MAG TPA: PPK2 family polyphosphate kinase [Saprospiraceae bacterium]|nr:PPK2 family polyphosphate kinase [Saprospiraceae bacterium]
MIKIRELETEAPDGLDKENIRAKTAEMAEEIGRLQHIMYAVGGKNLLVVLQGMDASGKDGTTISVFGRCAPTGIDVRAYKKPTEEEMSHDFLWRVHKHAPAKGMIMVFNRSHYEDILIQRVHQWIDEDRVEKRMQAINAFEELLVFDNDTTVLKFYLHMSMDEQREELQERIDDPLKRWKHNDNDWKESARWEEYMDCYQYILNNSKVPWHVIPSDNGWYRNYKVAQITLDTLKNMQLKLPGFKD